MRKSLEALEVFETQTEQELQEIMGGKVNTTALAVGGIALAYGVMVGPAILNLISKLRK